APMEKADRCLGSHDGDLPLWPRPGEIGTERARTEGDVCAAVCLPHDDRQLRNARVHIRSNERSALRDHTTAFLRRSGKEAGHVDERHDRKTEAPAERNE